MVAGVWLRAVAADPAGLVRCEHLRHFHSLNLSLNFVDEAGSELRVLESAHLSNVAELSLCSVGIHWNDVPTLLGNPVIQSLQSLNLSSNSLADWNPERISCESSPANLRELKLTTCGIRPEILESLIAGGWMDRLTSLSLGYNHCGNPGLSFIVNRPEAASLRSLSMAFNGIGRAGVAALCRSPYLGSLESLNLRGNELDNAVAMLFVKSQSLPRLRCLDLRPDYEANPRSTGRRRANMKISNRARKALRERFGDHLLL
jgi:Ran GTPase-activating protein (RanGAP) involved in mRNA processing and transport